MGTKVKGLLKGLKHLSITNIFDEKEQEEEIQIGFPTDVKHVAHIGMDDANTTTKPSWMTEHKAAPELASAEAAAKGEEDGEKKPRRRRDKDKDKDSSNHRRRKSKDSISLGDSEDLPVPKTARKKRNKGSSVASGDGSTKGSSRSKGHQSNASLPDSSFSDESAHGSKREDD